MKFSKLMVATAALLSTLGAGVAADAKDHRHRNDSRYERSDRYNRSYHSDRDRRYDRRDWNRRSDRRTRDRRDYTRGRDYTGGRVSADVARRNYELERDMQTCYRNGQRICP